MGRYYENVRIGKPDRDYFRKFQKVGLQNTVAILDGTNILIVPKLRNIAFKKELVA